LIKHAGFGKKSRYFLQANDILIANLESDSMQIDTPVLANAVLDVVTAEFHSGSLLLATVAALRSSPRGQRISEHQQTLLMLAVCPSG